MKELVKGCLFACAACFAGVMVYADEPADDGIGIGGERVDSVAKLPVESQQEVGMPTVGINPSGENLGRYLSAPPSGGEIPSSLPELRLRYFTPGEIVGWENGGAFGDTRLQSLAGMMGIESGRLGIRQSLGDLSFTAYGEALKYGFYQGLTRSLGVGGALSYRINDRVSVTVFGHYYSSPGLMSPAMAGYAATTGFGGYFDYHLGGRWGVRVGAQGYRSVLSGKWEAQPMVMPYFRVTKKDVIGIDVGAILYNLIKDNMNNGWGRPGNPTIAPPRM